MEVVDVLEDRIDCRLIFEHIEFISVDSTLLDAISIVTNGYIFIDPLIERNFVIDDPIQL